MAVDELWAFIYCKEANRDEFAHNHGDQYTYLAIETKSKLIITYLVGKRTKDNAIAFMEDLKSKVVNRFQLSTDGFIGYISHERKKGAVEMAFGNQIDYGTEIKKYAVDVNHERRYSAPLLQSIRRKRRLGIFSLNHPPNPMQNNTQTHHDLTLEPPRDQYGNPILPGYRKPFTSESGRQARAKAELNLQAERAQYHKLGLHKPKKPKNLLFAVQKAIVRHANASCEPNLPDCGLLHAKNAKLFHDIYQSLSGANPSMLNRGKRGSTKHIAHVSPMANVEPIASQKSPQKSDAVNPVSPLETTIQSTSQIGQDASRVKPEDINSTVSPITPKI